MKKLEHILAENMHRFATKNLHEQNLENKLDPEADQKVLDRMYKRIFDYYSYIKPKRIDMSEFENDIRDLVSIYKDKGISGTSEYQYQFYELYPISKTRSDWKGIQSRLTSSLVDVLNLTRAIEQGDTSSYLYRQSKK